MTDPRDGLDEEYRIDVGRAARGRTFVRVVHIPTGRERVVVGLGNRTAQAVADELVAALINEASGTGDS